MLKIILPLFVYFAMVVCQLVYNTDKSDEHRSSDRYPLSQVRHGEAGGDLYSQDDSNCTVDMFSGDMNAYFACLTEYALQHNWFPSPIAGVFSYLDWNGFDGFWQNGAVLETLANFCYYGNHTRYYNVLMASWRPMDHLLHAYYPLPSYDDLGWYGLAYARIYEVTKNESFLTIAKNVTDYLWINGWDKTNTCNGGFWFSVDQLEKNTITNAQMLLLAMRMYRFTKNTTYLNIAEVTLNYLNKTVVNHTTTLVADGIDLTNCSQNSKYNRTYNSGIFVAGLSELYKVTNNLTHILLAHDIAVAAISYSGKYGVLTEYCEWDNNCQHSQDGQLFKGIFAQGLRHLIDISTPSMQTYYRKWLQINIDSVLNNSICKIRPVSHCNISYLDGPSKHPAVGPIFSENWHGPFDIATPISQTSALDLFIANIAQATICKGTGCDFNPPVPSIKKLSCKDKPCPATYPCCERPDYNGGNWTTCCQPYQTCQDGGCY